MSGTSGDIDDPFGWIVGVLLAVTALVLLVMAVTLGWIIVGAVALVWFAYKAYRNSDGAQLKREIKEIEGLHAAASYARTLFPDMPDPDTFAEVAAHTAVSEAEENELPIPEDADDKFEAIARTLYVEAGYGALEPINPDRLRDADIRNAIRVRLGQQKRLYEQGNDGLDRLYRAIIGGFCEYLDRLPRTRSLSALGTGNAAETLNVSTFDLLDDPKELVHFLFLRGYDDGDVAVASMRPLKDFARRRLSALSGVPLHEVDRSDRPVFPRDNDGAPWVIAHQYLEGSPFLTLFDERLPFVIPDEARFEHTHIVAGTGHGKTQLFQLFIKEDIEKAEHEPRSIVVIDGQGDLIDTIAHMPCFAPGQPMSEKIVMVDPTDMEYPAALNMFDAGQDGYRDLSLADREMILNGTVELYSYLFGALLGAELTQKQEVIFRYLARLMLVIPGATIETLRELMENGEKFRPYVEQLEGSARAFFGTQFFDRHFDETKKQILRRLWGVLSNEALAQMFNHPRNKVDLYEAMNAGKVVLINTAKDLLKTEGSAIFGRFFIAMTAQAAIRRAVLPKSERVPTMVYIDEAHDYIDDRVEDLLNQARKFRVAMHLAHQNLGQLTPTQRATLSSSTSVKMMGGASAADAKAYASEMRCSAEDIAATRKRKGGSEFMVHVRNLSEGAVRVNVPFGVMERLGQLNAEDFRLVTDANRARYCAQRSRWRPQPTATAQDHPRSENPSDEGFQLGGHERL